MKTICIVFDDTFSEKEVAEIKDLLTYVLGKDDCLDCLDYPQDLHEDLDIYPDIVGVRDGDSYYYTKKYYCNGCGEPVDNLFLPCPICETEEDEWI